MDSLETGLAAFGVVAAVASGGWALFTWKYPSHKDMKTEKAERPEVTPTDQLVQDFVPRLTKPATRLVELFGLVNENTRDGYRRFTEEKFSAFMAPEDLALFSEIRAGNKKPTTSQLKAIAEGVGVNFEWLTSIEEGYTGRAPFLVVGSMASGAAAILRAVEENKVASVHLTHCPARDGESGVVITLQDGRYIIIAWTVQLCANPGGTGRTMMADFDWLIGELMSLSQQRSWILNGHILKAEDFARLHSGKVYPPVVFRAPYDNLWYDLFHDTTRARFAHIDVKARYGDYFVKAQDEVAAASRRQAREWRKETITLPMPDPTPEPSRSNFKSAPNPTPKSSSMPHDIFISYSAKDSELARRLQTHLKSRGVDAFLAEINIAPGADWKRSIIQAFKDSKWVFFLATPNSAASQAVMHELGASMFTDKPFVALMHGIKPGQLPAWVQDRQAIDLADNGRFESLVRDVVAKIKADKDAGAVLLAGIAALTLFCLVSKEK